MTFATNWVDFAVALVWPFCVVLLVGLLLTPPSRQRIDPMLRRLKRFKAGGFEFELTEKSARATQGEIEDTFQSYRAKIRREFDRMARIYNVSEKRSEVMGRLRPPLLSDEVWQDLRSTIHVADILFADTLYQLLDYYPGGAGAGRAFPIRRGVLGLAWRTRELQVEHEVSTDPRQLVVQWAMTIDEAAEAGQGRKSFLCVVLKDRSQSLVGVFYLDSKQEEAFGRKGSSQAKELARVIEEGCEELGLTEALRKLGEHMRSRGPEIHIFDQVLSA
jgi:hypothetical protein